MIPPEEMEVEAPEGDLLNRIVELANRQVQIEADLAALAEQAKTLQAELETIAGGFKNEGLLVAALNEAGMKNFTLTDGTVIEVKDVLQMPSVAQKSKYREPVLNWLDENHPDVIKRVIAIPLVKGDERVAEIRRVLAEQLKVVFSEDRTVNPQTLGALIRELLENGAEVPMETLGVFSLKKAAVEIPKVKK